MNSTYEKYIAARQDGSNIIGEEGWRGRLNVPGLNQDGNLEGIVIHRSGTFAEINDIVLEEGEIAVVIETGEIAEFRVGDGVTSGGLVYSVPAIPYATDSYIVALPGDDLIAKYNEAKTLTPNSSALSDTNRATLYIMKGSYALSGTWNIDTNFVDIVGVGATEKNPSVVVDNEINVTAWNVQINGVETPELFITQTKPNITSGVTGTASTNMIHVTGHGFKDGDVVSFTSLSGGSGISNNVRYEVAIDGIPSADEDNFRLRNESTGSLLTFSTDITFANIITQYNQSQKLYNCVSFGYDDIEDVGSFNGYPSPISSGFFSWCRGGNMSFGGGVRASGVFINCKGSSSSFGGNLGIASGTFTNCKGGQYSFGGEGTASGVFNNCVGGSLSFGGFGTASGVFNNCTGIGACFGGFEGNPSGTFTNCVGGEFSFGNDGFGGGVLSGKLFYCRLTTGNFITPTGSGLIRLSIDGNNNVVNEDPA